MPTAILDDDFKKAHSIMAGPGQMLHEAIAKAIADERERCAQVAEHLNAWGSAKRGKDRAAELAAHIAKCIRNSR